MVREAGLDQGTTSTAMAAPTGPETSSVPTACPSGGTLPTRKGLGGDPTWDLTRRTPGETYSTRMGGPCTVRVAGLGRGTTSTATATATAAGRGPTTAARLGGRGPRRVPRGDP